VTLALGGAALVLLRYRRAGQGRIVAAILAGCWLWVAWAFHWRHYATINWAAIYFAWAFVLEALFFIVIGIVRNDLSFESPSAAPYRIGCAVILFALIVQPLVGPLLGRGWTQVEVFGAAPDPTAAATLGFMLAARGRTCWVLWMIPVLMVRAEWRGSVDDGIAGCIRDAGRGSSGGDDGLEGEASHRLSDSIIRDIAREPPFVAPQLN
jgi:hypothetical protein